MSLEKCQKYLYKLSTINPSDSKFGLYLNKLNYWYDQIGGKKNADICMQVTKYNTDKKQPITQKICEEGRTSDNDVYYGSCNLGANAQCS